eukprot:Awhi_evm1s11337
MGKKKGGKKKLSHDAYDENTSFLGATSIDSDDQDVLNGDLSSVTTTRVGQTTTPTSANTTSNSTLLNDDSFDTDDYNEQAKDPCGSQDLSTVAR